MAGEPILIARNCALVILGEGALTCLAIELNSSNLLSLANAIQAAVLGQSDTDEFVVDDRLRAPGSGLRAAVVEMNRRSLILCDGFLEGGNEGGVVVSSAKL